MNDSELEMSLFSDLENLDRQEIEQNANDLERQIRTIDDEYKSLMFERKNQLEIVKSLRVAVGEMEEENHERRVLRKRYHETRKLAENVRVKRDELNRAIPPNTRVLSEWMGDIYQKLVTVNNDLTTVPTLYREVRLFKLFFEVQAAYTRKQSSEIFHIDYINHHKTISSIIKELDSTRTNSKKEKSDSNANDDTGNVNRSEVRKLSNRISKIDKLLDKLSEEIKNLRKEAKRIRSYLRITSSRGKPIKISEVKDRAQSGDSLNTDELSALLRTGGLSGIASDGKKTIKKKQIKNSSSKKQHRRLGVARGGARLGSRAAKRED